MAKRRTFTAAFKAKVAQEAFRGDRTVQQVAARYNLHPSQVSQWKRTFSERLVGLFERGTPSEEREREAEIRKLEKEVKQLEIERDFLKSVWDRWQGKA